MQHDRHRLPRPKWHILLAVVTLVSLVLGGLLLVDRPKPAQAKSSYLGAARSQYPGIAGTALDSCSLCHTSIPGLNTYGTDYMNNGHSFTAIESLDSDNDGFDNITEINALTFPGDSNSKPSPAPTNTPTTPPTATNTPTVPPTATNTPTMPPAATNTPTAPPAETATPTNTPVTPPTQTPIPTNTPVVPPTASPTPGDNPTPLPPAEGEYRLIGWNDLGMHWMSESFADLAMLPPSNTLWAQLIRQGPQPEIVTEGVTIEYSIVGNTYSAGKTDFWDYVQSLFGVNTPPNVGLTGATLSGEMQPQGNHFIIEGIPLTPYRDNELNTRYPYQLAHLVARDNETGEILAETTTVAPVSTETHCEACHADGMRESIATGKVETNILALHDRKEHTHLMDSRPVLCADCHASNALGMPGNPNLPSLSRAMHKKHAGEHDHDDSAGNGFSLGNSVQGLLALLSRGTDLSPILSDGGTENCYLCHPGLQTQSLRGTMAATGMTCTDCHGSMRDVANGGRRPWIDEPRCGECHGPQYAENPGKLYRDSVGHGGLYCEACHGTPHAILASTEPNDNIQNIALQGYAGTLSDCTVCHAEVPSGPGPHGPGGGGPPPAPFPTPRPGHGDHHGYVKFHGTVESLPAGGLIGTWTVSGWTVNVSDQTRIDEKKGHVTVGAVVEVRGQRTGDHTIDAAKIKVKKPGEGRNYVSFNGTITSPDPCQPPSTCDWTVNDGSQNRTVHIRPDTRIEQEHGPPVQGAMVEVRGWQKADGTIDAYHIEVKSSGSDSVGYVKFHGVIRELPASGLIGDWRVDDIWVHVTEKTHIEHEHGHIRVGARVEVRGIQLADGTVNATKIKVKVKDD